MHELIWWFGALHISIYILGGAIFCATWVLHRTVTYLKLWNAVGIGLREYRKRSEHKEARDAS